MYAGSDSRQARGSRPVRSVVNLLEKAVVVLGNPMLHLWSMTL